jgi:hypothetical protein
MASTNKLAVAKRRCSAGCRRSLYGDLLTVAPAIFAEHGLELKLFAPVVVVSARSDATSPCRFRFVNKKAVAAAHWSQLQGKRDAWEHPHSPRVIGSSRHYVDVGRREVRRASSSHSQAQGSLPACHRQPANLVATNRAITDLTYPQRPRSRPCPPRSLLPA